MSFSGALKQVSWRASKISCCLTHGEVAQRISKLFAVLGATHPLIQCGLCYSNGTGNRLDTCAFNDLHHLLKIPVLNLATRQTKVYPTSMDLLLLTTTPTVLGFAFFITLFAGVVKGSVGFAMPMVMISGLSIVLPPEMALAALIVPTFVTNLWQSLRQGVVAAIKSLLSFKVFIVCCLVMLVFSAQLVRSLPQNVLFLVIGVPVSFFALLQLTGWRGRLTGRSTWVEMAVGSFAGFMGGLSGVWGPPTVAYLTAVDTQKTEQMRLQGTIYGLGAVMLLGAHLQSGVLRSETIPLSILMVPPALMGMAVGLRIQDRIDQNAFRKATLCVLLIAGLNLVRRGLLG